MEKQELNDDELFVLSIIRKLLEEYARYGRRLGSTEVMLSCNEKEVIKTFEEILIIIDSLESKGWIYKERPGCHIHLR